MNCKAVSYVSNLFPGFHVQAGESAEISQGHHAPGRLLRGGISAPADRDFSKQMGHIGHGLGVQRFTVSHLSFVNGTRI